MKVFKASLRIMSRHKAQILIYFCMFTAIFLVIAAFLSNQASSGFSETKPNFTIINRDQKTPLTEKFADYLGKHGVNTPLNDEKQTLQDALFYHETEFILFIPKGFSDSFGSESPIPLETTSVSGSQNSFYLESLVSQFWNQAELLKTANPSLDDSALADAVLETLSLETEVEFYRSADSQPVSDSYAAYNRTQSYILLVLILLSVSSVTVAFRKPELRMRTMCAPVTTASQNLGLSLYCAVIGFAAWFILNVTGLLANISFLKGTDIRLIVLLLLNSFLFSITALAIAMIASYFITNGNSQNAFANFLSLALSFLGGCFVPIELMSSGLLTVARFTPVYWYSLSVQNICTMTALNANTLRPIFQAFGIQLLFAAAFLCAALAVGKNKNRAEKSFGTVKTELDH